MVTLNAAYSEPSAWLASYEPDPEPTPDNDPFLANPASCQAPRSMSEADKKQYVADCIGGRNEAVSKAAKDWDLNSTPEHALAYLKAVVNDARSWAGVLGDTPDKPAIKKELLSIAQDAEALSKKQPDAEAIRHIGARLSHATQAAYEQAPVKPTTNATPRAPFDQGHIIEQLPDEGPPPPFQPLPRTPQGFGIIETLPD